MAWRKYEEAEMIINIRNIDIIEAIIVTACIGVKYNDQYLKRNWYNEEEEAKIMYVLWSEENIND